MNIQKSNQTVVPCHILPRSQGSAKAGDREESLKGTHILQMVDYKVPRFSLKNSGYSECSGGFYALKTFQSLFYKNLDFRSCVSS